MSDEDTVKLDAQQEAAQRALRELEHPAASEAFRLRLRAQFVNGEYRSSTPRRVSIIRAVLPIAAAVAAVFIVAFFNQGADWELHDSSGVESVLVDGKPVSIEDLPSVLAPGKRIALRGEGRLDLIARGAFLVQLDNEVEIVLPETPGRWFGRKITAEVGGNGRLRVVTGPAFKGSELAMRSAAAEWIVTGTAFTAIIHESLLCLCVLEGTVQACPPGGVMEPIPAGERLTFQTSEEDVDHGPMRDDERAALSALLETVPTILDSH